MDTDILIGQLLEQQKQLAESQGRLSEQVAHLGEQVMSLYDAELGQKERARIIQWLRDKNTLQARLLDNSLCGTCRHARLRLTRPTEGEVDCDILTCNFFNRDLPWRGGQEYFVVACVGYANDGTLANPTQLNASKEESQSP